MTVGLGLEMVVGEDDDMADGVEEQTPMLAEQETEVAFTDEFAGEDRVRNGSRYPMRLNTKDGQARVALLVKMCEIDSFVMDDLSKEEVDHARYLWDHDFFKIVDANPLRFEITNNGREVAEQHGHLAPVEEPEDFDLDAAA